jgi:purine-binding chemotaxis protein CheW
MIRKWKESIKSHTKEPHMNEVSQSVKEVKHLEGKYLTFKLGEEEYAIEILKVHQIIQMQEVTHVPRTPEYVRGVINLRGKIIPVIELRSKFGMEKTVDSEKTCIIVVQIIHNSQPVTMGIIIDEVREVLQIKGEDIEETPSFGTNINADFILGIGKVGSNVKMLLDIDKVLTSSELSIVAGLGRKD